MKKIILIHLTLLLGLSLQAQRFGYVDTDYILENLPQYQQAQSQLETRADQWKNEIEQKQTALEDMLVEFENEKILLTDEQLKTRKTELEEKREELKNLNEKRYGPNGDLLKARQSLVKPIQDQVYNAVKQVADRRKYNFVFDKGSDLLLLYSDPKFDISEEVLRLLLPKETQVKKGGKTQNSPTRAVKDRSRINKKQPIRNIPQKIKK